MNQGVLAHAEEHSKGTHTHTKKLPITPFKYLKVSLRAHRYFESELFRRKKKKIPRPAFEPRPLNPGSSAQIMEPPHLQIQNHLKDQQLSIKEVAV